MFSHRPKSKPSTALIIFIGALGGISIGLSLGIQTYGYDVMGQIFKWDAGEGVVPYYFYKLLFSSLYISGILAASLVFWLFKFETQNLVVFGHILAILGSFIASASFEKYSFAVGMVSSGLAYPFLNYSPFYIVEALSGCQNYIPLHHISIGFGIFISTLPAIYFNGYCHDKASVITGSLWRFLLLLPFFNSILAIALISNFANTTDTVRGTPEELDTYRRMKYPEKNILEYFKHSGHIMNFIYIIFYSFFSNIGALFLSVTQADDFISQITPNYHWYFHNLFIFSVFVLSVALFYFQISAYQIIHVSLHLLIIILSSTYMGLYYGSEDGNMYFRYVIACMYIWNYISGDGPLLYKLFFRADMFAHQKQLLSICNLFSWGGALLIYLLGFSPFCTFKVWILIIIITFSALSVLFSTLLYYNVNFAKAESAKD